MIYVTGDMHGDIKRFRDKRIKRLKKGDYLIVCGDFGFVWDGSKKERRRLEWLGKRKYTILFIEGTHDNLDLIGSYPQYDWNGGRAHFISGKLTHLIRGGVFTIDGLKLYVFGGGESKNITDREPGVTWWEQELPSLREIEKACENLSAAGMQADYIITHECPGSIRSFLTMENAETNHLAAFFDENAKTVSFNRWFFGKQHIDKIVTPLYTAVYKNVLPLKEI